MKICPVRSDLLYVGGWTEKQTDITNLRVAFRNLLNETEK
jgi:hypothetical protein